MRYITKPTVLHPRTRCAKGETPTDIYKVTVPNLKHRPKQFFFTREQPYKE